MVRILFVLTFLTTVLVSFRSKTNNAKDHKVTEVTLGGVTNIKEVVNNTAVTIMLVKYDRPLSQSTDDIPPGGVYSGDFWIPWANNRDEFANHGMAIVIKETPEKWYFIWQQGEYVRYINKASPTSSPTHVGGFVPNGLRIPGEAKAGGERRMIVYNHEGKILFKLEKY